MNVDAAQGTAENMLGNIFNLAYTAAQLAEDDRPEDFMHCVACLIAQAMELDDSLRAALNKQPRSLGPRVVKTIRKFHDERVLAFTIPREDCNAVR